MFLFDLINLLTNNPFYNLIFLILFFLIIIFCFYLFIKFFIFLFLFFYIINVNLFFYLSAVIGYAFHSCRLSFFPEAYYNKVELRYLWNYPFFPDYWNTNYKDEGKALLGEDYNLTEKEIEKEKAEMDPTYEKSFEIRRKKWEKNNLDIIKDFDNKSKYESNYDSFYQDYLEDPDFFYFDYFDYYEKIKQQETYYLKTAKEEEEEGFDYKKYSKELPLYPIFKKNYRRKIFLKEMAKKNDIKLYGLNIFIYPRKSSFNFYNDFFFLMYSYNSWLHYDDEYEVFFWIISFFIILLSIWLSILYISILFNLITTFSLVPF